MYAYVTENRMIEPCKCWRWQTYCWPSSPHGHPKTIDYIGFLGNYKNNTALFTLGEMANETETWVLPMATTSIQYCPATHSCLRKVIAEKLYKVKWNLELEGLKQLFWWWTEIVRRFHILEWNICPLPSLCVLIMWI